MDHARDTIDRLCTLAGMIMEDTVDAALISGIDADARVSKLAEAGRDIAILADAAAVVVRRHAE